MSLPGVPSAAPAMRRLSMTSFMEDPGLYQHGENVAARQELGAPAAPPGVLQSEQLEQLGGGGGEGISVDERVIQQLRGIFAAHDSDKDLMISGAELSDAVRALGFTPSAALLARFMARRPQELQRGGLIDLTTFLLVATQELKQERRFCSDVVELFELFDPEQTGTVPASTLRHILHETLTPERLSQAEVTHVPPRFDTPVPLTPPQHHRLSPPRAQLEEFLQYAGLRKFGSYGAGMRSSKVDYHQLLDKLMI